MQSSLNNCFIGKINACEAIHISLNGDLSIMQATLINVGNQKTSGVDWKVNLDTTFLLNFDENNVEYKGTIDGNNGAYSKIKSNLNISVKRDILSLHYGARFVSGMNGEVYGALFTTSPVEYHNCLVHLNLIMKSHSSLG